ncbi:putative reverse transcriptase zinc-binding domain-containing protein [Helianthus annuus]|nr:putative reverse transcriptase zinc-binding domain-containing protein [Helianthus annuus]
MLLACKIGGSRDSWAWGDRSNGSFTVAKCKEMLIDGRNGPIDTHMKWEGWVPLKVNLIAWRAELDRLPTRVALVRRRISIPDMSCPLCSTADEDLKHLLVGCGFAYGVWSGICKWCKLDPFFAYDYDDLLMLYKNVHGGKWRKKIIRGIVMVTTWVLWNTRNVKIFQDKDTKIMEVVAEVKSRSFLWLKNRSKFKCIDWKDWAIYPLYMCI